MRAGPGLSVALALGFSAGCALLPREATTAASPGPPAMNRTVEDRLTPQVERLLDQLVREGRDLTLDGERVFNGRDKFLPGKIAIALAYSALDESAGPDHRRRRLADFRAMARLTLQDDNREWGIYYYLLALQKLDAAGLLDQAVDAETLATLKTRLDWRTFVRPSDLTLINLPNNYYGVAYSVAQLRQMLGWEDAAAADALLARTLAHYRTYSKYGFADETEGQGRYDRYSVLLIGEIAQRFIETGVEPPEDVRRWLRQSAEVLLLRIGPEGYGFEYGRSIGAYGETAFLEVLSAAAFLNLLSPEERDAAYAFSSRATQRYMDFWVDPRTGSVNLWDGGRRTDAYRGKHRILGENLSLARQYVYTNALWNRMGYEDRAPSTDLALWRDSRPKAVLTWFSRSEDREHALFTWRDGGRVFGLPLINGGPGQHMNNPYYPMPFSPDVIAGSADAGFPQLTFRYELEDGRRVQATGAYRTISHVEQGDRSEVRYHAPAFNALGSADPQPVAELAADAAFSFSPGRVARKEQIVKGADLVASVEMEFATFSDAAAPRQIAPQRWDIPFGPGAVGRLRVEGFSTCVVRASPDPTYAAPTGAFRSVVSCAGPAPREPLAWALEFRPKD